MKKIFFFAILPISFFVTVSNVSAQVAQHRVLEGVWPGEVTAIQSSREHEIGNNGRTTVFQNLSIRLLEGDRAGEIVTVENDFRDLKVGEKVLVNYLVNNTVQLYSINDRDRRWVLWAGVALFVGMISFFGRWQGVRSLVSLGGALIVIFFALVPAVLHGFPPIPTSIAIATLILAGAIYFTHGFNRESTIAFSGTVIAVLVSGTLAWIFLTLSHITGFSSEEALFLNFNIPQYIDFAGLLLGGIIIGALGVLDDIAVTQVAVVRELLGVDKNISTKELYRKALKVGQEHAGALVNTLALAYAGASLPLILVFSTSAYPLTSILNQEVFATEIFRTIAGTAGLIIAVPVTTYLAARFLKGHVGVWKGHSHHS